MSSALIIEGVGLNKIPTGFYSIKIFDFEVKIAEQFYTLRFATKGKPTTLVVGS
jgi:hypothetical protein